ncbi:MAG: cupin [Pseudomonadota bacterium]
MKPHREFFPIDMTAFTPSPGYPDGFAHQVLADDLDAETRTGSRTILQRIAAGARTEGVLLHDEAEEVFVFEGDLIVGEGAAAERFEAPAYACRPGGTPHGPFASEGGCLILAVFYFA